MKVPNDLSELWHQLLTAMTGKGSAHIWRPWGKVDRSIMLWKEELLVPARGGNQGGVLRPFPDNPANFHRRWQDSFITPGSMKSWKDQELWGEVGSDPSPIPNYHIIKVQSSMARNHWVEQIAFMIRMGSLIRWRPKETKKWRKRISCLCLSVFEVGHQSSPAFRLELRGRLIPLALLLLRPPGLDWNLHHWLSWAFILLTADPGTCKPPKPCEPMPYDKSLCIKAPSPVVSVSLENPDWYKQLTFLELWFARCCGKCFPSNSQITPTSTRWEKHHYYSSLRDGNDLS